MGVRCIPLLPFALLAAGCVQTSRTAEAAVLRCDDLGGLIAAYQTAHYSVRKVTPEVEKRAAQQFVRSLDPSRTLLLDGEVKQLEAQVTKGFERLRRGECGPLEDAFTLVRERAARDTEIARATVKGKFEVDRSVELVLDPTERGHPKTIEDREKLIRDFVHFQMANYLERKIELPKAKKQLVHRYELTEKRLEERAKESRVPEMFAEAFARSLDPHTAFMSHDTLMDFQIHMKLSLEGIGAALRSEDGFTYIESLIPGGGAEKSGKLRPKDKIIAVTQSDEEPVSTIDMSIRDVVKLIRGKKGTSVTLSILRDGTETRTFDVTIVRDKIDVAQQAASLRFEEREEGESKRKVAVLELPSFYGGTKDDDGRSSYEDVKRLLGEAKEAKADALVLDLSKNGGGYLEDAVRISGLFLREGAIVATKDTGGEVSVLRDDDASTSWAGPLVVVVSPVSASASEILAGALKAYRRAVVVGAGQASFGKGSVQTLRPLPRNLGAMKVTTGMYFLPSGDSTQQKGVAADITVPSLLSAVEMGEKDLDYSLPTQSTRPFKSGDVNDEGEARWAPVSAITLNRLSERSTERVKKTPLFREVEAELAKAADRKKRIKLSEFGEGKEDAAEEGDELTRFERLNAAFIAEAVDIALDLAKALASATLGARTPG